MKSPARFFRAVLSALAPRPRPGQIVLPRREDAARDYPSAGLTPSGLTTILREADAGAPGSAMQLFEEMEEKDAHLFSVANTRRLALTGLDWQITSAAAVHQEHERSLADQAAEYCRAALRRLDSFEDLLQHLSLATGRNIAIAEIVWDFAEGSFRPIEFVLVDFTRIVFDELDRPRVLTDAAPREGMLLPPSKFVVHTPHSASGHAQRGGLLRVTAMIYLAKNFALKDWLTFAELFGMPLRIARYEPNATAQEKRELLHMLESLGSSAAGIFSRAVELQFIESARGAGGAPYQRLIEFLNREMSKAWLGQTLTTDISGQSGSVAASRVHEEVRQDLLLDDIRKEARTVRRDVLAPMARLQFGSDVPVPFFHRKPRPARDLSRLVEVLDAATNRLGLRVPEDWMRDALGLPAAPAAETRDR